MQENEEGGGEAEGKIVGRVGKRSVLESAMLVATRKECTHSGESRNKWNLGEGDVHDNMHFSDNDRGTVSYRIPVLYTVYPHQKEQVCKVMSAQVDPHFWISCWHLFLFSGPFRSIARRIIHVCCFAQEFRNVNILWAFNEPRQRTWKNSSESNMGLWHSLLNQVYTSCNYPSEKETCLQAAQASYWNHLFALGGNTPGVGFQIDWKLFFRSWPRGSRIRGAHLDIIFSTQIYFK